jgi:hypothetical protein
MESGAFLLNSCGRKLACSAASSIATWRRRASSVEMFSAPWIPYSSSQYRTGTRRVVRGETGDQTDQESRSAGHPAIPIVTAMDITIHLTFLPQIGGVRWITVGPADQPDTSIVLEPPTADPGITDD